MKKDVVPKFSVIKMEDVFKQNIDRITSVEFLDSLLVKEKEKENYEFCIKIRDRLNFLLKK